MVKAKQNKGENKMTGYIYNSDSMEVIAIIKGETNAQCEAKADELGYMGNDECFFTYSDQDLILDNDTQEHQAV